MSVTFRKAERADLGLVLSLAGGTGSGKTWSAMALAKGIAQGKRFAVCDTERGRASFYADEFDFDVFELAPPFSPDRYLEIIKAAEAADYPVLVIDSMSHEWEGEGGLIEWHDQLMGGQEARNLSAWIKPKLSHRKMVNHLVQAKPHVILCFRAAERVEVIKKNGKTEIVPKQTLTGLDGWVPITEKSLPFEATASFLLIAGAPGVPHAIKLPEPLKALVPLDKPISEEVGVALGKWASGSASVRKVEQPSEAEAAGVADELLELAEHLGKREATEQAVAQNREKHADDRAAHVAWLRQQRSRFEQAVNAAEQSLTESKA